MEYKQRIKLLMGLALVEQGVEFSNWTSAHDKLLDDAKTLIYSDGELLPKLLEGTIVLTDIEPETRVFSELAVSLAEVDEDWNDKYDVYVDYICKRSRFTEDDANENLIILLTESQDVVKTPKFNHAYDLGFEIVSDTEQATDVTGDMLRESLLARIASMDNKELLQTCNCFDTHEVEQC
tara:strand:+ start:2791 stop:3330 length:540 start_codon:yes stop_codon:yes gene_type:complete